MSRLRHAALVAVAAILVTVAGLAISDVLRGVFFGDRYARAPFTFERWTGTLTKLEDEATAAGLRADDRLVAFAGEPYVATVPFERAVRRARPGDRFEVRVRRADGADFDTQVLAARINADPTPRGQLAIALILAVFVPLLCVALGVWVVAVRPHDRMAWLVLALLASFAMLIRPSPAAWPAGLRELGTIVAQFLNGTWGVWMMLFGLWFPAPFPFERRIAWLKWLVTAFLVVGAAAMTVVELTALHDLARAERLYRMIQPLAVPSGIVGMLAIGTFFLCFGIRSGTTKAPDARRRLRILLAGTCIALTPLFVLILYSLFTGVPVHDLPARSVLPALLMLALFPVTIAYVIVVERAMDVRVAIRLGARYLLAKNGLRVAIFLFMLPPGFLMFRILLPSDRPLWIKALAFAGYVAVFATVYRVSRRAHRSIDRRFFRDAYDEEQVMKELADQVGSMVEAQPLLETLAGRVASAMHIAKIAILTPDGGAFRPAYALGYERAPEAALPESGRATEHLRATGAPAAVHFDARDSWVHRDGALAAAERSALESLQTELLVPLTAKGRLQGIVSLGPKLSEQPYSRGDLKLLRSVASQAGLALENSRLAADFAAEVAKRERLNREIEIARQVQEGLFPRRLPEIPGLDLAGLCRPAAGVGGDYWDFLVLSGGRLGIAVGDVAGKGIPAALLMASLQASLRGQTLHGTTDLARLMGDINHLVHDTSPDNRYATFFYGQYDPATRRFDFVNAGHNPPIVWRPDSGASGEILRLSRGGLVVGLMGDATYVQDAVTLRPGDVIVGFSDGISEAMNADDEEWGEARLIEALKRCDSASSKEIVRRLFDEADRFVAGATQHDDMTLVVVRVS